MSERDSSRSLPSGSPGLPQGRTTDRGQRRDWVIGGILLVLTFGYVGWFVETPIRAYNFAPEFFMDGEFARRLLAQPGGALRYVSRFGGLAEAQGWVGAACLTGVVGLLAVAVGWVARGGASAARWVLGALPGLVLLAVAGRHTVPVLELGGGGLAAVMALGVWRCWAAARLPGRWACFWALAALVFHGAGLFPFLALVVAGGGIEGLVERRPASALGCWLAAVLVPVAWVMYPGAPLAEALLRWGKGWSFVLAGAFYPVLVLSVVAAAWLARGAGPTASEEMARPYGDRLARRWAALAEARPAAVWGGLVGLAVVLLGLSFDAQQKVWLRVQRDGGEEHWEGVLRAAARLRTLPPAASVQVNRALYHTGNLLDDLFAYPRSIQEADVVPSLSAGVEVCPGASDTWLELGQVNLAEHYAHEAMEVQGERADVLRRLARINALKDRPVAARVFLNRLSRIPFQRDWAEQELQALTTDPTLGGDAVVARARAVQVRTEMWGVRFTTLEALGQAQAAGTNRMAFEFLIAQLLLTQQVDAVVQALPRFEAMGYTVLPRHVEEAVLMHLRRKGEGAMDLERLRLRQETFERFKAYARLAGGGPGGVVDEPRLAAEFGDTYWFYLQFGYTPGTRE